MGKFNGRKVLHLVIAILTAIVLWIYVDNQDPFDSTVTVRDIPVEFTKEDTTLAEKNLMLLSGYDATVDLKLKGSRKVLWKMDTDEVRVVVDCANIDSAGTQSLTYSVVLPDNVSRSDVTVADASVYRITVRVGELYKKEIPVRCEVNGQVAPGYFAGDLRVDTETLVLRAQREDLLNVSYAKAVLDVGGATSTVVRALEYTLYDYNNVPVENDNIRASTKLIQVVLPVRTVKEVPLAVELLGVGAGTGDVEYEVEPRTVSLLGEAETLALIDSVTLDAIYVEELGEYQRFTYDVTAPVGTTLTADSATSAEVTVVVDGATQRVIPVTNIILENIADGLEATAPERLDVTIWGVGGIVDLIEPGELQVRVDLSGVTAPGVYKLPAAVSLHEFETVAIKGTYEIEITVSEYVEEDDAAPGAVTGNP